MALRGIAVCYYSYSYNSIEMPMHLNCAAYLGLYSAYFCPFAFRNQTESIYPLVRIAIASHQIWQKLIPDSHAEARAETYQLTHVHMFLPLIYFLQQLLPSFTHADSSL